MQDRLHSRKNVGPLTRTREAVEAGIEKLEEKEGGFGWDRYGKKGCLRARHDSPALRVDWLQGVRQRRMKNRPVRPDQPGSLWSTGPAWAHVSNTPFRLYKRNLHEGGICTPLVVRGPRTGYPAGEISGFPVHILDFMPTFLAWAGHAEAIPAEAEGQDLSTAFNAATPARPGFHVIDSHFEHRMVREDEWKLVSVDGRPWELYRMDRDPLETDNLAPLQPERVSAMERNWIEDWRRGSNFQEFVPQHRTGAASRMNDRGGGARYVPGEAPEGW